MPFTVPLADFTLAFWIKTTDIGMTSSLQWFQGKGLLVGEDSSNQADLGVSLITGRVAFGIGPSTTIFSGQINDGGWHSVAACRQNGSMSLHVDGIEVAQTDGPNSPRNVSRFTIGAPSGLGSPGSLDGMLADVRIYSGFSTELVDDAGHTSHTTHHLESLVRWLKLDGNVQDSAARAVQDATAVGVKWLSTQGGALQLNSDAVLFSPEFVPLPLAPCVYSAPMMFRGSQDTIRPPYDLGPVTTSSPEFTVAMWIRPTNLTSGAKFFEMSSPSPSIGVWLANGPSGKLEFGLKGSPDQKLLSGSSLFINKWVHIAVVISAWSQMFFDGVMVANQTAMVVGQRRWPHTHLGSTSDRRWAGIIKDFFLWNTAISEADLASMRTRMAMTIPRSSALLSNSALLFGCAESKFCFSDTQHFDSGFAQELGVVIPATAKGFELAKRLCSLRFECTMITLSADGYHLLAEGTSPMIGTYWRKQRCGSDVCSTVANVGTTPGSAVLTCPLGTTINSVVFADYGTPSTNLITDGNFDLVKTDSAPSQIICSFAGNVAFVQAFYADKPVNFQKEGAQWVLRFTQEPNGVLSFSTNARRGGCSTTAVKFFCTTDDAGSPWKGLRSTTAIRARSFSVAPESGSQELADWKNSSFDDTADIRWQTVCASTAQVTNFSSTVRASTAISGWDAYTLFRVSVSTQAAWTMQNGQFVLARSQTSYSASLCASANRSAELAQTFATRPFMTYELRFSYYSQALGALGEVVIEGESSEQIIFRGAFGPSSQVQAWTNSMLSFIAKTELTTISFRSLACVMIDDINVTTPETCGGFASDQLCFSPNARQLVERQCLGRNQCIPNLAAAVLQGCATKNEKFASVIVSCNNSLSRAPLRSAGQLLRYDFYSGVFNTTLKDIVWDDPTFSGILDFSVPQLAQPTTTYRPERFAVRWTGIYTANQTGLYSFLLSSKDGSELYVDDRLVISNDGLHDYRAVAKPLNLSAGPHSILVRWFYATARSQTNVFQLQYKPPSIGLLNAGLNCSRACGNQLGPCAFCGTGRCCQRTASNQGCVLGEGESYPTCVASGVYASIPPSSLSHPLLLPIASLDSDLSQYEPGVTFEYRRIPDSTSISLETLDFSSAPLQRGVVPFVGIWHMEREDYFSLRFTGQIRIPQDGMYTFYVRSDDGFVLNIGGSMVVWNDRPNDASQEVQGAIDLRAGYYELEALYFETWGNQVLQIEWQGPGMTRQALGSSSLTHRMLTPPVNFGAYDSFTVEIAVSTKAASRTLVSKLSTFENGRLDTGWWLQLYEGKLQFWVIANQVQRSVSSEIIVNDGQWHHIAAVRNVANQELRLYVDYRLDAVATDPTRGVSLASQAPLGLGLSPVRQDSYAPVTFDFLKVSTGTISPANFKNSPATFVRQHPTYILRSPAFRIESPTYQISAWVIGGAGHDHFIGTPITDLPNVSSPTGFMGLALLRLQDNVIVATMTANSMVWKKVSDQHHLAPNETVYYQLLFIDSYHRETNTDRPDWMLVDNVQLMGVAWCVCPTGSTGLHCEFSNARTCNGHGIVVTEGFNAFHCECDLGWYRADCSSACPGFHGANGTDICNGHGRCFLTDDFRQTCDCDEAWSRPGAVGLCSQCSSGWFGKNCSQTCPGSGEITCNQHGQCSDGLEGTGRCSCDKNWAGTGCTDSITEVISPAEGTVWETDKLYPIVWNSRGFLTVVVVFLIPAGGKANDPIATVNNTGLFQYRISASQPAGKYFIRVTGASEMTFQNSDVFEIRSSHPEDHASREEEDSSPVGLIVGLSIAFLLLLGAGLLFKFKRVAITEWLLWKLGNFRFDALRNQKVHAEDAPELPAADTNPTDGEHKAGQHIEMI